MATARRDATATATATATVAVADRAERLPPGRHGLPPAQVAASQRTRLLRAVVDAVGAKGYAGATIADVTTLAGVSKKTFYEHFSTKEECFLAAYEAFTDDLLRAVDDESERTSGDWQERMQARFDAYLTLLAMKPARTRALVLEVLAAGPAILAHRREILARFERSLYEVHAAARAEDPGLADVPRELFALLVGGCDELLRNFILDGRIAELPSLSRAMRTSTERLFASA